MIFVIDIPISVMSQHPNNRETGNSNVLPEQGALSSDVSCVELFAAARAELLVGEARAEVDVTLLHQHRHLLGQLLTCFGQLS